MVEKHNSDPTVTWTMALNQFSDITDEEFKAKHLGSASEMKATVVGDILHQADPLKAPPASADYSRLTRWAKNQNNCGCSWAFAAAATAEVSYNLAYNKYDDFSPQQLLSCSGQGDCNRGYYADALRYYLKNGAVSDFFYKYVGVSSACDPKQITFPTPTAKSVVKVSGSYIDF
jgi:hypothetical protein